MSAEADDDNANHDEEHHEEGRHDTGFEGSAKNPSMTWDLLQKGLKRALGPTRDQLEFAIKIRSMFDSFDHSGDGKISGDELRKALKGLGVHISRREMNSLMMRFDQNHDNEIDHSEFEDMVRDLIPPPEFDIGGIFLEQKLKAMFEMMDINGDRQLDAEELRIGLQKLGMQMHPDHMHRIIASADHSGDGCIDYDEFVKLYTKYPVHHHSEEELQEIERKWEQPEQIVRDCRPPYNDEACQPGRFVRIRKAYAKELGYHRLMGVGLLTGPVKHQPGRWYVKFKTAGETFLNVGRHGVYELAYMDTGHDCMGRWSNKGVRDLGAVEEEADNDVDESEQTIQDFRQRLMHARLSAGGIPEVEQAQRGL